MNETDSNPIDGKESDTAAGDQSNSPPLMFAAFNRIWLFTVVLLVIGGAGAAFALTLLKRSEPLAEIQKLVERQSWSNAESELDKYLARSPDDARGLLLYGRVLAAQKRFAECAATLEKVPTNTLERGEALLRAGQAWQEARQRRAAERAWSECLELPDTDIDMPRIQQECRRQLCSMFALERRRDELRSMTEQLLAHALPLGRHEALEMRARYEFVMVDPQIALGILEPVLERDPNDFATRRAVGIYQLEAGNAEKARAQLYRCVQERRDDVPVWESWLHCLYQTADLFGLEQALRELPATADRSAVCWKFRAIVAERQDNVDEQVRLATRALELEPNVPEHQHRLGQALLRQGKKAEAQVHLARNAELQSGLKDLQEAYEQYKRAYVRASSDDRVELAFAMAQNYERLGRAGDALAWHSVALAENPAHAPSIDASERLGNEARQSH